MKRCPQCEFIYEDDQSLCDMDGVLLVFDARTLPNLHALATVEGPMPGKVQRRSRMAPAFATILLALGLGSAYFVSTRSSAPAPALEMPTSVTTTAEAPAAVPSPSVEEAVVAPTPESQPASEPAAAEPERKPTTPAKKAALQPAAVKPGVKPAEPKKDDSKVGSILKKTGKILKKPFKF